MPKLDVENFLNPDSVAKAISDKWTSWRNKTKEGQWQELRNYVFATDTTTTTNAKLPWKNKTTRPKLCQIRDNLHANYMSAVFPNDRFFKWQAATNDDADMAKRLHQREVERERRDPRRLRQQGSRGSGHRRRRRR